MTIDDVREYYKGKKGSVKDLCDSISEKIKNSHTNGCVTLCRENEQYAQYLFNNGLQTPVTGLPIAVKDNICVKNVPTTCASNMLKDFVPSYDATAVERLKKAGAVIICKTNMDEFAMGSRGKSSCFGSVNNPLDISRSAGGSSCGSAALVAEGCVPVALGSDTGGSVRQPAGYCGVTGFKPSFGAVSRYGLVSYASDFEQIGVIANSSADCAAIFDIMRGCDCKDMTSHDKRLQIPTNKITIGIPQQLLQGDSACVKKVLEAALFYEKQGAVIKEVSLPCLGYSLSAYYVLSCAKAASNLARYDGVKYGLKGTGKSFEQMVTCSRSKGFGDEVKARILLGNYVLSSKYYDNYYSKAQSIRQALSREFESFFKDCDLLLSPTSFGIAPKLSDSTDEKNDDIYTVFANLAGLPSISMLCGYVDNMPVGVSLTAQKYADDFLLKMADSYDLRAVCV